MSQLDVLKSLLRSSARSAGASLRSLPLAAAVQRVVTEAALGRTLITDAQLTAAVARVTRVRAVTVSCRTQLMRVDASFDDDSQLVMALIPSAVTFAPGGAKEVAFEVEPTAAAFDPRSREVLAAIAGEIARCLWRPVLARAPRSDQGATVSEHDEGSLVIDLRSVPEVRWALRQRLPALVIEMIKLRSLEIQNGRLALHSTLNGPA